MIRAYFSGAPTRTGNVTVRTKHHLVDEGFSIPTLDDHFSNVTTMVRTWVHEDFVVFYHYALQGIELIVFRRSVNKRKFVNLRLSDDTLVAASIKA